VLLFALLLTGCYGYHCWQPLLLHFLQFLIHIQDTTSVVYEDSSSHICGGSMRWIYRKSRDRPWSEVTLVTWPEVTSPEEVMTGSDRVYVRNRKLCNIRPSGDFWPEITSPLGLPLKGWEARLRNLKLRNMRSEVPLWHSLGRPRPMSSMATVTSPFTGYLPISRRFIFIITFLTKACCFRICCVILCVLFSFSSPFTGYLPAIFMGEHLQ
jgi:hypothetical protein